MNAEFLKALLKLKADIGPVLKNAESQHTNRKYADIAAVHKAIDEPLQANGFVLYHEFEAAGDHTLMHTHLLHEHGELKSTLPLSIQQMSGMNFYQAMGSAITYQRRYAIMALLGLPAEDDDGNSAADKGRAPKPPTNGNGQKVTPKDTNDKMRAFLFGDGKTPMEQLSYHLQMITAQGKPCPDVWADKFCALLPMTASGPQIDKLATENGATLKWLRDNAPEQSARITKALQDAHSAVRQTRPLAAAE